MSKMSELHSERRAAIDIVAHENLQFAHDQLLAEMKRLAASLVGFAAEAEKESEELKGQPDTRWLAGFARGRMQAYQLSATFIEQSLAQIERASATILPSEIGGQDAPPADPESCPEGESR